MKIMMKFETPKLLNSAVIAILLNLTYATLPNSHNFSQAQTRQTRPQQTETDKLRQLANKYYQNNQPEQALSTLQKELKLHRQTGDVIKEISTLNFIAIVYDEQSKYPQAMEYLQLALTKLKTSNISANIRPGIESELLIGVGYVYANQGKYQQALETARRVKVINNNRIIRLGSEKKNPHNISSPTQSTPDIKADADTLYNIALSQSQRGKVREALGTAETVLKMRITAKDKAGEREVSNFINSLRQRLK
jgi:tetratricopeptide (TPR) repeat protein